MNNRIKQLMKEKGLSRDDVADALEIHPITVSKLVNGRMKLTQTWMEKFSKLFKVPPEQIIAPPSQVRTVRVRQHVQAGEWSESNIWDQDEWYDVAIPDDPTLKPYDLFGAETRGPSMDRRYPEGTVVIATSAIETGADLIPGKRYIVERERADGLREATVKTLWRDDQGTMWLLPDSLDPRYQEPIPLQGAEGDMIRIVGRVRYSVQRED